MAQYLSFYQVTSVIWAVVSDGKQAYGFKYRRNEPVCEEKVLVLRGNKPEPAQITEPEPDEAKEPSPKVTNETVKNFIPTIAAKLEKALAENAFDYVVIVAPKKTLEVLRSCLSERLRDRVLANMPDGYAYDRGGAIFALREEASAHFTSYTDTICRSLPPCCTREEKAQNDSGMRIKRYRTGSNGYEREHEIYVIQ